MLSHGISALNWVCRWHKGLLNILSPAIHILAGEKVCIQVTTPIQEVELLASRQSAVISCGVVTMGLKTKLTGNFSAAFKPSTISFELLATCFKVSGPYKC